MANDSNQTSSGKISILFLVVSITKEIPKLSVTDIPQVLCNDPLGQAFKIMTERLKF